MADGDQEQRQGKGRSFTGLWPAKERPIRQSSREGQRQFCTRASEINLIIGIIDILSGIATQILIGNIGARVWPGRSNDQTIAGVGARDLEALPEKPASDQAHGVLHIVATQIKGGVGHIAPEADLIATRTQIDGGRGIQRGTGNDAAENKNVIPSTHINTGVLVLKRLNGTKSRLVVTRTRIEGATREFSAEGEGVISDATDRLTLNEGVGHETTESLGNRALRRSREQA